MSSSQARPRSNTTGETSTPIFDRTAAESAFAVADKPQRNKRAEEYEKRVQSILNDGIRMCAASPRTVADAAALIAYGDSVASKTGDLADADPRVRRAVDFITSGTENPYLAMAIATVPLAAQIIRNHETKNNVDARFNVRIPFTKKTLRIPFRIRLKNPVLRSVTQEPSALSTAVFSNPLIAQKLKEARIAVAWEPDN